MTRKKNTDKAAPVVEAAAPEAAAPTAPTAAPVAAPVDAAPTVRPITWDDDAAPPTMADLRTAASAVRTGSAGWWYMHAPDGKFGNGGKRYTHRLAIVDGIGDALPDGTRPINGVRFVGLTFDADGTVDPAGCASWVPSTRDPAHAPMVKADGRTVAGLPSTAGNGGPAPQCADTRGARITLHPNVDADGTPTMVVSGAKGGAYSLSGIVDADGTPLAL